MKTIVLSAARHTTSSPPLASFTLKEKTRAQDDMTAVSSPFAPTGTATAVAPRHASRRDAAARPVGHRRLHGIAPPPPHHHHHHLPRGIGFDLGETAADKLRPDEESRALIDDVASLLMMQDAMRGETGQAFLALMSQIAVKATPAKILQAYGNFFRAQLATGADSFVDHVLDEVIAGRNNPLASVCAKGERAPRPVELAAAAADLELLQRFPQESTILGWCQQMVKTASPSRTQPTSWIAAAEQLGRVGGEGARGEASSSASMGVGMETGTDKAEEQLQVEEEEEESGVVLAPASAAARKALRETIMESWSWGEALPALTRHWREHGVEDVQAHSVLTFSPKTGLKGKGKSNMTSDDNDGEEEEVAADIVVVGEAWDAAPLPGTEEVHKKVSETMIEHVTAVATAPKHILVHGPPGAGKRWLLRSAAGAHFPAGLRCVCLSRGDLRALPELLDAIRAHPRVRFVVLLEMPLSLAPYAEFHNELTAALDGGGGVHGWPNNAQLCATALRPTALKPGAEDDGAEGQSLAVRFGLSVALEGGK